MKKLTPEQDKFLDMLATTPVSNLVNILPSITDKWKRKMLRQQIKEDLEDYSEYVKENGWINNWLE